MAWDATKPAGTDAIKDSDDAIRANWAAIEAVFNATGNTMLTDGVQVTASAAELNKLDGASANVTATNLNTLTAGATSDAAALHYHASGIDHGQLGGLADDDHTQYLNTTRHDTTTRHPVSVIKFSTGSYSEALTGSGITPGDEKITSTFTTNYYTHEYQVKKSNLDGTGVSLERMAFTESTSYQDSKYRMKLNLASGESTTVYCQWAYHSASEQGIWGIWDTDLNKLVAVLIEENSEEPKLEKPEQENRKLVKFKNPEKYEGKTAGDILEMNIPYEEVKEI